MNVSLPIRSSPKRGWDAYTLLEVLIGMSIVGIMAVSFYAGMSSGFAITQLARENLRATQIMVERMEGIRLHNWDQVTSGTLIPTNFTEYYYPPALDQTDRGILYRGTVSITQPTLNPSATYGTNMRIITVSVRWTSANVERNRTMSTYVARYGMQNYIYHN
jgi:prepilin-type N-terminal cleavage/methylation domain-containing protein